jgi:hypothetical protein
VFGGKSRSKAALGAHPPGCGGFGWIEIVVWERDQDAGWGHKIFPVPDSNIFENHLPGFGFKLMTAAKNWRGKEEQ